MKKNNRFLLFFLLAALYSCSPYKQLEKGEYLLNKNTIKIDKGELKEGAKAIIKQKANRKILGLFRFHLGVYTLGNGGKPTKFKNWLKYTVGEEPVILDTSYTAKSTKQIKQYMENNGYFDAVVKDTTIYKKKKAFVRYEIKANNPYFISNFERTSTDLLIHSKINLDTVNTFLVKGKIYSKDDLQKDRERITENLRNDGYFYFNPQYVSYKVINNSEDKFQLKILQVVSPLQVIDKSTKKVVLEENHKQYTVRNIYVRTDYDPLKPNTLQTFTDTLVFDDYQFISSSKQLGIKPNVITEHSFLRPDLLYEQRRADKTYKSLNGLGIYKFINISFLPADNDSINSTKLDALISLSPHKKQDYKIENELTNNGGNLGIAGDVSYRNKNFLKGAEYFEIKLRGAMENQKNFTGTENQDEKYFFNTFEAGIENSISLPKALWPLRNSFKSKTSNPQTVFAGNYNIQKRPEFYRSIWDFSASLEWRETRFKKHIVTPVQINFINVDLSDAFKAKLIELGDPILLSSYDNHVIANGRYSFIFNNQIIEKDKDFIFFRTNVEFAGNSLRLLNELNHGNVGTHSDSQYVFFKKQFAQYIKPDVDFRYYRSLSAHSSIVYRLAGGIGITYLNSKILPFEKAFFAGGSNDLRAFRARTVGPGSYSSDLNYERIGDIKINTNLEYRFDILKILKGAFFIDAGNIWLRQKDEVRPGAEFQFSKFANQLAIGSGFGLRVDFIFFIFRLDIGVPLKNPALEGDKKYVYKKLQLSDLNFNFGIGYPF